jgi:transcriptional regulator with XRE-family HTH domain
MTEQDREARLAALADAYLEHLDSGAPAPKLSSLPEDERAEARQHLRLLRALWGADTYEAPPTAEDPVAIRFGFDRVAPTMRVSGRRVRDLRHSASMRSSELADRLVAMGHDVTRGEMAAMERSPARIVPVELAAALAAALDASVDDFEAPASSAAGRMTADDFVASPFFDRTVTDWATARGLDPRAVANRQAKRVVQLRHRGEQVLTTEHWHELLIELLEADDL